MFQAEDFYLGSFKGITIGNMEDGVGVSFVPEYGATITSLKLKTDQKIRSVLDPISSYKELVTNPTYKNIWLSPFPNRVAQGQYDFKDQTYSLPKNEHGINALHGFVYQKPFEIVSIDCCEDYGFVSLKYVYEGGYEGYPFPFECHLKYIIYVDAFKTRIELINKGSEEMPAGLGWHPYFKFEGLINDLKLTLPLVQAFKTKAHGVPVKDYYAFNDFEESDFIGHTDLDHCFETIENKVKTSSRLFELKTGLEITLWQDHDFLQVYTPPDRRSIAIEPMTCAADSFNNKMGLKLVKPEESLKASCGIMLSHLKKQETVKEKIEECIN